jgi:hypothetical protein
MTFFGGPVFRNVRRMGAEQIDELSAVNSARPRAFGRRSRGASPVSASGSPYDTPSGSEDGK